MSSALPTPVQCRCTRRPTSVNIRIAYGDGTWATYTALSLSKTAMLALSPVRCTSSVR